MVHRWNLLLLLSVLLIPGFEAAFKCNDWPVKPLYGCKDDGQDWKQLANSASTKEACKSRCEAVAESGDSACCFWSRPLGCNIKVGAKLSQDSGDSAFAIDCKRQYSWLRIEIYGTVINEYVALGINVALCCIVSKLLGLFSKKHQATQCSAQRKHVETTVSSPPPDEDTGEEAREDDENKQQETKASKDGAESTEGQAETKKVEACNFARWRPYENQNCFINAGVDRDEETFDGDLEKLQNHAINKGYGAFVIYDKKVYFKEKSSEDCRKSLVDDEGAATYLPEATGSTSRKCTKTCKTRSSSSSPSTR